ncbi:TetR/AcrR family transcriptional regulator [Streptomyces sp. NPDC057638]|uniref:TetR/AcrR family transcriptional regulator n=1 Tax=Streptomyces sp. NPDC057638 TaxID=3346190 RepID=UPI0036CF6BCF
MTGNDDGESWLPASVEAAWGLRERPAKGPRPALSIDRIVTAAVELAAREGLGAVSMGRVAKELGASTMSLYRYVAAKDELYLLMQEAAVGTPPPPPPPGTGWREALLAWAGAQRDTVRRNPWMLRLPIAGPPLTPNTVAWWERGLAALDGTALDEGQRISVIMLISGFIRQEASIAADLGDAVAASGLDPEEAMRRYARTVERLVDPVRHPLVTRLLESGVLFEADDPDHEFTFGMARILDGVDTLIRARTP